MWLYTLKGAIIIAQRGTTNFKAVISLVVLLFSTSFSYAQLTYELRVGLPLNVNSGFKNHLTEEYGLQQRTAFGLDAGIIYAFKNGFYMSAEIQSNDYFFNQDTLALRLSQINSVGGIGKELKVTERISFGIEVDFGACLSTQHWYQTSEEISYLQALNKNNYSVQVSDPRIRFYLGSDLFMSYRIGKSACLFVGFKNSILPMRSLTRIDNQSVYGFYFCPYFGLRGLRFRK